MVDQTLAGIFRINADGAYKCKIGGGRWGFIIRNDERMAVKAGAGDENFLQSAFHAELLGLF